MNESKEFYLNIYRDRSTQCGYSPDRLFYEKEHAIARGQDHPAYICTVKIEVIEKDEDE